MEKKDILFGKRAYYQTLGCKLNFAETSALRDKLKVIGVSEVEKDESADICILNTCSVTDVADQKCRQAINRMHREHPEALLVVIGCYAQLQSEKIAFFPGVDIVVGMEKKGDVVRFIEEGLLQRESLEKGENIHAIHSVPTKEISTFIPSCSCGNRTRYFIKVQDGCNYHCTYCTIPFARGKSRNGSIDYLVKQARDVASRGGKEIVITGVNIGDFGKTTGESLLELLKKLDEVEGIERYRISSIEPNLLTDEIIEFCASSRAFMPHFHIPLQSGSDEVLKLMKRRYNTNLFAHKIEKIHSIIPDAFIGVDVIVGTRGETSSFFEDSYSFISTLDISQLHVFSYSERPNTKALEIPHIVTSMEKKERSKRLLQLSEEKRIKFYLKHLNTSRDVLWEHSKDSLHIQGFTDNYIKVVLQNPSISIGQLDNTLSKVRLTEFSKDKQSINVELV